MQSRELLEWYLEAGVDEAVDDHAVNYFTAPAITAPLLPPLQPERPAKAEAPAHMTPAGALPLHHSPSAAMAMARQLADRAATRAELEEAVRGFDGCAIKKTASKTVFSDGNPEARLMIIGEAPGAQEDIKGIPFCGPSGMLLDRMLAAIGLNREQAYISNTVFWRPPGNRQPSSEELAICLPFVEKHIALINPQLLVLSGGTATMAILRKEATVSRLRGKAYDYTNGYLNRAIPTVVTYHPSYLLRSPQQKRLAWHDFLIIKNMINH